MRRNPQAEEVCFGGSLSGSVLSTVAAPRVPMAPTPKFEVGDWVVHGLQVGQITKVDPQGRHAVQIKDRQFWRKPSDLKPLFGTAGRCTPQ